MARNSRRARVAEGWRRERCCQKALYGRRNGTIGQIRRPERQGSTGPAPCGRTFTEERQAGKGP